MNQSEVNRFNKLYDRHQKTVYSILFSCVANILKDFALFVRFSYIHFYDVQL